MAFIENVQDKRRVILLNQHTIGRDQSNASVILEKDVSRRHAVIHWQGDAWYLTDYSSNGTQVNANHFNHGTRKLKKGDVIQFSTNEYGKWKLLDTQQPNSYLRAVHDDQDTIDLKDGIIINGEVQHIFYFHGSYGWIMDNSTSEVPLVNGHTYFIYSKPYVFVDNEGQAQTEQNVSVSRSAYLHLVVSEDEESVSAKVQLNDLEVDLGDRSYNHLLLYLARMWHEGSKAGVPQKSRGWVYMDDIIDSLSKEVLMDIDEYYVNNLVYRLRKNLLERPPYGHLFCSIIERKKGMLRLGLSNFKIEKEKILT